MCSRCRAVEVRYATLESFLSTSDQDSSSNAAGIAGDAMPPKKPPAEQTPSKSLLNFFDRSPATDGSPSTIYKTARAPRKSNETKHTKRAKSGSKPIVDGSKGTLNAPLVISDDDESASNHADAVHTARRDSAMNIKGELLFEGLRRTVINISDDEMEGETTARAVQPVPPPLSDEAGAANTCLKGEGQLPQRTRGSDIDLPSKPDIDSSLIPNGILSSILNAVISSDITTSHANMEQTSRGDGSTLAINISQKSDLEQALEEEEGEWNEGDEEGMGMEDLDIGDDDDVMADTMESPAVEEEAPQDEAQGGEKRKRKGKQKVTHSKDCSPEIIAIDQSDDGDDDSLGGREEVDDFDVDDEECPVCGRTFVGLRGDVSTESYA